MKAVQTVVIFILGVVLWKASAQIRQGNFHAVLILKYLGDAYLMIVRFCFQSTAV